MGIINTTPDSFYSGSRKQTLEQIGNAAGKMHREGASILDLGAYSSRPGAEDVSEEEEWARLSPALQLIRKEFPDVLISIDTFRASIADKALSVGADVINDISGGQDSDMPHVISAHRAPYILMHMRGTPQTMKSLTNYENIIKEIFVYFQEKIKYFRGCGVNDIIIDPGLGFAKTVDQNFHLLDNLHYFRYLGLPILAGLSRKSMIYKTLESVQDQALNGTTALHMTALANGAQFLRAHDVKEAIETITLYNKLKN